MAKIPKNRQDSEMFAGIKEQISFENSCDNDSSQPVVKPIKSEVKKSAYADFFTLELQEDIGKALLNLKLALYKEGIVDYTIKVIGEDKQVILKAVPVKKQHK